MHGYLTAGSLNEEILKKQARVAYVIEENEQIEAQSPPRHWVQQDFSENKQRVIVDSDSL